MAPAHINCEECCGLLFDPFYAGIGLLYIGVRSKEMELKTVKDAFDRVSKKQELSYSKSQEMIEQVIAEIAQALSRVQSNDDVMTNHKLILTDLKAKLKGIAPLGQLEATQKELNAALSKYPKLVEKTFNPDISKAYRNIDFDNHTVNHVIAGHFYREGQFDLADCFVNEARELEAGSLKSAFLEMHQILKCMKSQNPELALKWAASNQEELKKRGSDIEWKLHCLQFVKVLQNNRTDETLDYTSKFIAPFRDSHFDEIQSLMGCLVLGLDSSPYATGLLSPTYWEELSEDLIKHFCNLMGQSYKSPLSVTIAAGAQGLPTLLKLMDVIAGNKQLWQSMEQLPVPVELDRDFQFHSFFVCLACRELTSEENPPMLLPCGHVMCKLSIMKLSKDKTRPFKCHCCYGVVVFDQCRQIVL